MPDYSKGLIYRIDCNETGECYIGSTTQGLANRIAEHRKKYKHWKAGTSKNYCCSYPIIERGNYTYEMIIEYPCKNKQQLNRKEGELQRSMPCVNKNVNIAGRTMKEWKDDNKEIIKEKDKKYREDNKEKVKEQKSKYRKENKEKLKEKSKLYRDNNKEIIKEKDKKYREDNKEKEKKRSDLYYQLNKAKILERQRLKRLEKKNQVSQ